MRAWWSDLGNRAVAVIVVSSLLPWIDVRWISTGCAPAGGTNGGVLSVVGILGWLVGVVMLVVAIARDRRDLLLLPAVIATLVGLVLLLDASFSSPCSDGIFG